MVALQGLLSLSEMLKFNYTLRELRLEGNLGDHEAVASFAGRSRRKFLELFLLFSLTGRLCPALLCFACVIFLPVRVRCRQPDIQHVLVRAVFQQDACE